MRRLATMGGALLLGLLLFGSTLAGSVCAEESWETLVRQAEEEEDRDLQEARQRGTTRNVVRKYASRVSRQPTALNHYLLGRASYYDGDLEGAERNLRKALQIQPTFWFAKLRLAMLALQQKRIPEAERLVAEVVRVKPREPDALKLLIQLRMEAKDWDGALRTSEDLLAQEPGNEAVRRNIAFILMAKEDWPRALKELRVLLGRNARDPAVRWYYATALFQTGDLKKAAREFEGLLRMTPDDIRALDMLRLIYHKLNDLKSLEKTLGRMYTLLQAVPEAEKTEESRGLEAKIKDTLERLRAGPEGPVVPPEAGEEWPENSWMKLIEQAMDPTDVEKRRQALQTYYEVGFPRMPHALVGRVHPDHEPDPVCRQWLLRIMGQMQNPQLAQVTAYALYDPDANVREKAADTLGEIATPSGLLYLMPMLLAVKLEGEPTETQVMELNAARRGMIAITSRLDAKGGAEAWVAAKDIAGMQQDWLTWLESPEGVHARVRAIHDLEAQGDLRPELHVLEDVADPHVEIASAAYKVMLNRSKLPSDDKVAAAMWPRFPVFPDSQLTKEGLGAVRGAVKAWWTDWRAMRAAAAKDEKKPR